MLLFAFSLLALAFLASLSSAFPPPAPASIHSTPFSWVNTTHLLALGDSYTYVQGTAGRQNYSFIGDAFNYSYTPSELLSTRIVQNQIGTSAGGPNWVEYLTGCYAGLPAQCNGYSNASDGSQRVKQKQLWDFAFAGADISADYLPLHHNYSVDLDSQIKQWDTYARPYLPVDPAKGLAAIWIGINDISDSAKNASLSPSSFPSFYAPLIARAFSSASAIADAGYTNLLIMQLPPLDRTPGNVANIAAGKPASPNATQIADFNAMLADGARQFAAEHAVKTMVFDTYGFLNGVIDRAESYGLKNTTGYCPNYDAPDIDVNYGAYGCLPIDEYFWYNTGHVTYRVHEILAAELRRFLEGQG